MESMKRAKENECKTIGFSLLSAGIFRGHRPLGVLLFTLISIALEIEAVLTIGLRAIMDYVYEGLEAVYMVGYMQQEVIQSIHIFATFKNFECSTLHRIVEHFHENKKLPEIVTISKSFKKC